MEIMKSLSILLIENFNRFIYKNVATIVPIINKMDKNLGKIKVIINSQLIKRDFQKIISVKKIFILIDLKRITMLKI
ncbi:hypothetical protein BpHYR1_036767 [Brachionus plicatilis]|uniref:Uncharacterized protein n=1 Tax=Brachionus plicatilis TaxID=10195 RepID=A0A3M7SZI1_BRAPC|nr:hypothetical protein BpHYR1_036767 [Brachionus plicatilis]